MLCNGVTVRLVCAYILRVYLGTMYTAGVCIVAAVIVYIGQCIVLTPRATNMWKSWIKTSNLLNFHWQHFRYANLKRHPLLSGRVTAKHNLFRPADSLIDAPTCFNTLNFFLLWLCFCAITLLCFYVYGLCNCDFTSILNEDIKSAQ